MSPVLESSSSQAHATEGKKETSFYARLKTGLIVLQGFPVVHTVTTSDMNLDLLGSVTLCRIRIRNDLTSQIRIRDDLARRIRNQV